ncbi:MULTISPECIES: MobV family relaxase [Bacilli]|jgi:cell division protein FtsB|nr:MobV family relaxase [Listeria monocytogenes]EAE9930577.1 mobilization protein [Listeria monocytogenes]EAK9772080.1 mobilization protein [Listeria monocytogenes]EDN9085801.1 mobilization protein [Listeria monocytogenes]EJW3591137.1 plasmid recombination protein [Listeria monocytogenes]EJW3602043.1 plasmid recombination protein [Listeria monocytogenes]
MAHLKKNTRGSVKGLSIHFERKTDNHSNEEIDVSRSYLNQDLMQDNSDMISRFDERLENVYCMKREDVKALGTWVVTLPDELKNEKQNNQNKFFEETKEFLDKRYGKENVVCAVVHYDETTPHLHYAFIPVTFDEKKQREKVSAKEVLNRKDLQTFHDDLDKHLKEKLPFYEKGILNDKTLPFENVEQVKKYNDELKKLTEEKQKEITELKKVKQEFQHKKETLKGKVRDIDYVYRINNNFEDFERKLKRTTFGKRIISEEDLKKLGNTFNSLESKAIKQTRINDKLKEKFEKTERDYKQVKSRRDELIQENEELERKIDLLEDKKVVYADILKNDYGLTGITQEEFNARLVLNRIENDYKPRNRQQGEIWVDTLKNARETKIEPSRLERGIDKAKELLEKVIEIARNMSRGIGR